MKKAAWILPVFGEGSGGHRTIFQNIAYLSRHGYRNDVYVEDKGQYKNAQHLKKKAVGYFGDCGCRYYLGFEVKGDYDIVFATSWQTAAVVNDCPAPAKKAYFIQDFEPCFYPMGERYLAACHSYHYDLHFITIGKWLAQKLQKEYGRKPQYFDFCADSDVYYDMGHPRKRAICFLYQPEKPRRCARLGIAALRIVKRLRPDVDIYLYGSDIKGNVGFAHTNRKLISIQECNELYNECSVGLCISSSNPSRIPFEMMAAGLPVVDLYLENNLYDMPQCVSLAFYEPEAIAQAILHILGHPQAAGQMSAYGKEYMRGRALRHGFAQFHQAVENIVCENGAGMPPLPIPIKKVYWKQPVTASRKLHRAVHASSWPDSGAGYGAKKGRTFMGRLKRNRFLRNSSLVRNIYLRAKAKIE